MNTETNSMDTKKCCRRHTPPTASAVGGMCHPPAHSTCATVELVVWKLRFLPEK
ncbi:unnamed protein product [Ectocarpus fasciculatus]